MKPLLVAFAALAFLSGCSFNEIEISNGASENIEFVFRGETFVVKPAATYTLEHVPDGTFSYSTLCGPNDSNYLPILSVGTSDTLEFKDHATKWTVVYKSEINHSTKTYEVTAVNSSNLSLTTDTANTYNFR